MTSETTVSGSMFDDVIKTQVQGAIRGARRIGEPKYLSDTSVEITYEVKMEDIFQTSRVTRTPVNDVIDALEARREQKKLKAKVVGRRKPRRRKKIVYDDFGEPLRVIWVED